MNVLNDDEIDTITDKQWDGREIAAAHRAYARAIEAAVIKRLAAGVRVEPHEYVWNPDGTFNIGQERCLSSNTGPCHGWEIYPIYSDDELNTAIAAARVQAENEALRTDIAGWNSAMGEANADIEALRTANAKPRANIEKTGAMHTAVRNALMHHKLTSRPDGVIESDLIYAVLDCIKGEQG